jgi:hypothetical protein
MWPRDQSLHARAMKVNMRNRYSVCAQENLSEAGNNAPEKCPFLINRTRDANSASSGIIFGRLYPDAGGDKTMRDFSSAQSWFWMSFGRIRTGGLLVALLSLPPGRNAAIERNEGRVRPAFFITIT